MTDGSTIATPALEQRPARIHVPALDGLRGVAILMVLVLHLVGAAASDPSGPRWLNQIIGAGWIGVDLFFVLSGFLITGILLDSKDRPHYFRNFYARRTLRIFPLNYLVLIIIFGIFPLIRPFHDPNMRLVQQHQIWLWLYCGNIALAWQDAWFLTQVRHLWSLAVEEQFYLIWPLLVWVCNRRALGFVAAAMIAMAIGSRWWMTRDPHNALAVYTLTWCRMDGLAIGALLALAFRTVGERRWFLPLMTALMALGAALVAIVWIIHRRLDSFDFWTQRIGYSGLSLFFAGTLTFAVAGKLNVLANRVLRFFGKYSYAMYLFHLPLLTLMILIIQPEQLVEVTHSVFVGHVVFAALMIGLTTGTALLSWYCFERPILGLKRFFDD
jgi:peptidoglycan/LPS O-acetylase OafA/YrhL